MESPDGVVGIGDLILVIGDWGRNRESGGAAEGVIDSNQFVRPRRNRRGYKFGGKLQGSVVGEGAGALAVGDGGLLSEAIKGERHIGRGIAVVDVYSSSLCPMFAEEPNEVLVVIRIEIGYPNFLGISTCIKKSLTNW